MKMVNLMEEQQTMGKYFGTDGIRGQANVSLTAQRAFEVGRYLGYFFGQEGKKKIVIGKDTRISGDMFEAALAAGIVAQGCDVYLVGCCSTPVICYLTTTHDFACGAMISASHNPYHDNGIKVFSKEGIKLPSDIEDLIEQYIDGQIQIEYKTDEEIGRIVNYHQGLDDYITWMTNTFKMDLSAYHIAMDCANGSATYTAKRTLEALGAHVTVFHDEPDGLNINTNCGSTHPEAFAQLVKDGNYDLGLTFDGDADRQILVAENGELFDGDYVLYIAGKYLKEKGLLKNNTIVTTVMANIGLLKAMQKEDILVETTKVGDKYVYERMCEGDFVIGGEQSGHIIFKKYATTGDGLLTALAILEIMVDTKKSLLALGEGLTIYPQLLVNVKVRDKEAVLHDEHIQQIIEEENRKLDGNGRILVRPSGTEPLLRVMAEAFTDDICKQVVGRIARAIEDEYGI